MASESITVTLSKKVTIPDHVKVERYRRNPEVGPRILFFTGGSALRTVSREIVSYTHNSIHLITPFDSGGSSAELRKAFDMLAVGDIRNRLMALADKSILGNPEIFDLFAYRLSLRHEQERIHEELSDMIAGKHPLVKRILDPMRKIIRNHLNYFHKRMPEDFNLKGASIGNLVLTGGYLNNRRHIEPVIYIFSKLIEARGIVRPLINTHLHLAARLENGKTLVGQHNFSGKEHTPIDSRIEELQLVNPFPPHEPVILNLRTKGEKLIESADLICYPIGSFYSSIVANLLVKGVGKKVKENGCPKVYVPNLGNDPEQFGMDVVGLVRTLLRYLQQDADGDISDYLNFIVVDTKNGFYPGGVDLKAIRKLGIEVIDLPLITKKSAPYYDEKRLIETILSLS